MKKTALSPGELSRARSRFYILMFFNVISFTVVSENIITLYALRLGADSFLVGLISSFLYFGFLAMLIGRPLAARMGMIRLYGTFWLLRYLVLIPLVFAPLLAEHSVRAALMLLLGCIFSFHFIRGIGVTGYNPVLGEIAGEKDRGAFLARNQTIVHLVTPIVGVVMGFLLAGKAPLYMYSVFVAVAILAGMIATYMIFKLPEPIGGRQAAAQKVWRGLRAAFARRSFSKFILIHFFNLLLVFMIAPFIVLYVKRVYLIDDQGGIFLTVIGSLGALAMSLVSGFLIDKLGARPLFFIFSAVSTIMLVPLVVSPPIAQQPVLWVFLAVLFFFQFMGRFGLLNAGQTYFFSVVKPGERLNLGIVYLLTIGIAGGVGSMAGGAMLAGLQNVLPDEREAFRLFFLLIALLMALMLFFVRRLDNVGAYPILNVLSVMFSPRDLRAMSLIHRLRRSRNVAEEQDTIRAMGDSQSELSVDDILERLSSPRFAVRVEALTALSKLPGNNRIFQALVSEVKNQSFTTAYMAAGILGQKGVRSGIKVLRRNLYSSDFFLAGKCMVSLAKLRDRSSIASIESIMRRTSNPRLIIHGAIALEIFSSVPSIPVLLGKLEKRTPPRLRDEIMLSVSGILGIESWFYPHYVAFLEKSNQGLAGLLDFVADNPGGSVDESAVKDLLWLLPRDREEFAGRAREHLSLLGIEVDGVEVSQFFRDAVANEHIIRLDRFCFLLAAVIIWYSSNRGKAPGSSTAGRIDRTGSVEEC